MEPYSSKLEVYSSKLEVYTGCLKKMSFSGKTAVTTFKLIQNANVGGVLESSGNLLHYGH